MVDCLSNLDKCGAECCKVIPIPYKKVRAIRPGTLIRFTQETMTSDAKWYYELHNCTVRGSTVSLRVHKHWWSGNNLIVASRCNLLTEDNLCSGHESGEKPECCKKLDHDQDLSRYYLTPNCVLKRE